MPNEAILVWVVNATTGTPLSRAEVSLLSAPCYARCTASSVRTLSEAQPTGPDGVATFPMSLFDSRGATPSLYALVRAPATASPGKIGLALHRWRNCQNPHLALQTA